MVANVVDPERDWTVISIDGASGSLRNSVYVEDLRIDQRGTLTADVYASCFATDADFLLKVTDSTNLSGEATLRVTVLPNTPPVLSYPANNVVLLNQDLTIYPSAGPSDNSPYVDVLWQSFGTYGGVAAISNLGVITIPHANPEGTYTLIAFSEDYCGLRTSANVPFTVLGENIFANSFEDIARIPAKMQLPLGAAGETMRLPLPMFAPEPMEGDVIVDLIEFDIGGSRVLLQARRVGDKEEFRLINFNAPADALEGEWMNGTQPQRLWLEWRGRVGWVDAILHRS